VARTKHLNARMNQRGIRQELVDLAMQFGVVQQDKCFINEKGARELIIELEKMKRSAQKIVDKRGLAVIDADGTLLTTYNLGSYKRQAS